MKNLITEQFNLWGVIITVGVLFSISFFLDMDALKASIGAAGIWAPLVFIILKASTVILLPLSGAPLYPIVGAFFGVFPGVFYVIIGDFIGYTVTFFISRIFGFPLVHKFIHGKEEGLLARIVSHVGTVKGFVHTCLTCFAVPELISYGTGLSKLPYRIFISIIMPLSALASLLLVFIGDQVGMEGSLIISFALPLVAIGVIALGGGLFIRTVLKQKPKVDV